MTTTPHRTADPALRRDVLGVLVPGFLGTDLPSWARDLLGEGLAGLWLFGHNVDSPAQVAALTAQAHACGEHVLMCSDEEGGTVTRLHHRRGSPWPGAWALGQVDDPALTETVARALGEQLSAVGIDLGASPVADVNSEPDNLVIGVRSFGADARGVATQVAAYVRGLAQAGVLSCAKHFPGHGTTRQDSHLTLPTLDLTLEEWREAEMLAFRAAIEAGADLVMTGHLVMPQLGELPATLNPRAVALLREELGFTGVVCTDAIDMQAVASEYGRARGAVLALAAGADLVCIGNPAFPADYEPHQDVLDLAEAICRAVQDGELPRERLAQAAQRVRALGASRAALRQAAQRQAGEVPDGVVPDLDGIDGPQALGDEAARRALHVHGPLPAPERLRGADLVGTAGGTNMASGARQEVVLGVLAAALGGRVLPASEVLQPPAPQDAAALDAPAESPAQTTAALVVVVDDHHDPRDPATAELLRRADVVLHTGVRPAEVAGGVPLVRTHGGGAASARAAAAALTGAV